MILPMIRARILGPREDLDAVIGAVQDVGLLQLGEVHPSGALRPVEPEARDAREARHLRALLRDVDALAAAVRPRAIPAQGSGSRGLRHLASAVPPRPP